MALTMNTALQNELINAAIILLAGTYGTEGTANLKIYSGEAPGTAGDGTQGTAGTNHLIVEISGIKWNSGTDGSAGLIEAATGTAGSTGIAAWGRLESEAGGSGLCIDGDVGVNYWNGFTINSVSITLNDVITLANIDIFLG